MINIDYILSCHGFGGGGSSKDKTPPPPVTGFTANGKNAQVVLSWTNPVDTDFVGVKILRKEGSYPASPTDGVVVYSGANTSYTDTTVTNGTQYNYHAYTFDYDNNFNTDIAQEATATPRAYLIYGVKIDTTNSNPETAVTYIENAVGFTPASGNNGSFNGGSWLDKFPFNQIKPCVLKADGTVNYYLSTSDYTRKVDGVTGSNLSGADGNVMVEFPKLYWKFETIGTDVYIRYSDVQIDSSYKCLAHMRGTTEKAICYIGAYLGHSMSSKLWSVNSVSGTASQSISTFRTLAQANGAGYDIVGFYQWMMLQILYIVMFKNLDSQTALGYGYSKVNTTTNPTGNTNAKGLYYGETTGKIQLKCFGIEDLWGNLRCFLDGFFSDSSRTLFIANQSFNNSGSGYTQYGTFNDVSGFISSIIGTTELGFTIKTNGGSSSTYYCDGYNLGTSSVQVVGGTYSESDGYSGMFMMNSMSVNGGDQYTGARIMYL